MSAFRVQFSTLPPLDALVMDVPGPPRVSDIAEIEQWQSSLNGSGEIDGFRRTLNHLYVWRMQLEDITAADFAAIEEFFAAVSGNAEQFSYTHTDGVSYDVRFWGQPQYRRSGSRLYNAALILLSSDRPQEPTS